MGKATGASVSPSVLRPAMFAGALFLAVGMLFWYTQHRTFTEHQRRLLLDVANTQARVRLHLDRQRDYLQLLAAEMAHGILDAESFQARTSQYVADHPELLNVTWMDTDFVIRQTAPFEPHKQVVGLKLSLPEPQRTSCLVYETRRPAYTRPFVVTRGHPAFEIHVPVFRGGAFLGTLGGVYSAAKMLRRVITPSVVDRYQLKLFGDTEAVLVGDRDERHVSPRLIHRISLTPSGQGLVLQLARYKTGPEWGTFGLGLLITGLALGLVWGLWGLKRQIVERGKAEATLRQSEMRFRDLIEGSNQGVVIHRNFAPLFVNQAYAVIYGYENPTDVLGLDSLLMLIAPHERERLTQYAEGRLRGEEVPTHYEFQGLRQDGTVIWLNNVVRVVSWQGGPAVQSTVIEISKRKEAENALKPQRDWVDVTLSSIGDAVIATDTNGIITFVNRAAEMLTEWPASEAVGRCLNEVFCLIDEQTRQPLACPVSHVLADGVIGALTNHTLLVTRTGREVSIADPGVPIYDSNRGSYGVVLVFRDITESKRLQTQLRQAQKMQAIGTLAGGIAHEFNNVLAAILGFTELTQYEVPQGSKAWQNSQAVLTAGHHAKDLVQQILAFSRQSEPELVPVPFHLVMQEALALVRATLPASLELRAHVEADVGKVLADRTQLHQIVINLCANAEHAMRETGGILEVCVDVVAVQKPPSSIANLRPGAYVCLTVRDTGHGIAPSVQEHIFEPFFTTKDMGQGTGMGLAIVHGIVLSHGGAITAESTPDQGSTFSVYLPQIRATVDASAEVCEPLPRLADFPPSRL